LHVSFLNSKKIEDAGFRFLENAMRGFPLIQMQLKLNLSFFRQSGHNK